MSRILLVEDEQHLATGLQFNLESDGHDVEVAESGEVALARVDTPPPLDLVVLDVMLPGCDGFHVADGDATPRPADARAHVDGARPCRRRVEGFAAGADDYLPKPFDLSIFLARVRGLLRRWA